MYSCCVDPEVREALRREEDCEWEDCSTPSDVDDEDWGTEEGEAVLAASTDPSLVLGAFREEGEAGSSDLGVEEDAE